MSNQTKSKIIEAVNSKFTNRGKFNRPGIDKYVNWINNIPTDNVIFDSAVEARLKESGYNVPLDPASLFDIDQVWSALLRYPSDSKGLTYKDLISRNEFQYAYKLAQKFFGREEDEEYLTPLRGESEFYDGIQKSTSAGIPYFAKKIDAFPVGYARMKQILSGEKKPNPCLAQIRKQRGNKTRLVWAYPLDMTLVEAKFAVPLLKKLKVKKTPMVLGLHRYEIGSRIGSTLVHSFKVELDYSKFDSSISTGLITMAFNILKSYFKEDEGFDKIIKYFINTPIVMPNGHLYVGKHGGVPSGSYFTNLIDSIVNFIIIMAFSYKHGLHINPNSVHVMGDDSIFSCRKRFSIQLAIDFFSSIGITVNEKKSQASKRDSVYFVGFNWVKGVPDKPEEDVLLSLTQPERFRKWNRSNASDHADDMFKQALTLSSSFHNTFLDVMGIKDPIVSSFMELGKSNGDYLSGYLEYTDKYIKNLRECKLKLGSQSLV